MYNQVRSSINIPPRALGKLADTRAKVVKTFLVNSANVDTNRLFLLNSRQHLQRDKSGVTLTLEANWYADEHAIMLGDKNKNAAQVFYLKELGGIVLFWRLLLCA